MPIYKMQGKKDGLQKYRVRINYTDRSGKPHQLDRVAYGAEAAKELERQLSAEYSGKAPAPRKGRMRPRVARLCRTCSFPVRAS